MTQYTPKFQEEYSAKLMALRFCPYRVIGNSMESDLILYTTDDGQSQLVLRELGGQVWLTQLEMAELYQTSKQNISKHVKAVLSDGELAEGQLSTQSLQLRRTV